MLKYLPRAEEAEIVDATGKIVYARFDSILMRYVVSFGGSREHEFEMRLEGKRRLYGHYECWGTASMQRLVN
ncbi:hypothetical protein LSPH24S_00624 [Lysinibacillus sphaericus]